MPKSRGEVQKISVLPQLSEKTERLVKQNLLWENDICHPANLPAGRQVGLIFGNHMVKANT